MAKTADFGQHHPAFRFVSYDIKETEKTIEVSYLFEMDGFSKRTPCWSFPKSKQYPLRIEGNTTLCDLVFGLGLVQVASYWKRFSSSVIEIGAGRLDDGLGEWFSRLCTRQFDAYDDGEKTEYQAPTVICTGDKPKGRKGVYKHLDGVLMPLDYRMETVVALELVKEEKVPLFGCALQDDIPQSLVDEGEIPCENVFSIGYDCKDGETFKPDETAFAFAMAVLAYIHRLEYLTFSFTSGESEYGKSILFERELQWFLEEYMQIGLVAFSILRPMSTYHTVSLFAGMLQYHSILEKDKSDAALRSFCLLAPFLPLDYLSDLYGDNLLESESALHRFEGLIGAEDAVDDEMNFTVVKAIRALELDDEPLPFLLRHYKATDLYETYDKVPDMYSRYFDSDHCLPERFEKRLRKECFGR